ncbi:hypothetical protein IscW_ISCW019357 [Ixodes scapularis]|uniref:Uncharacterized protein n=1 Tax=Ixodes scapularis TaxID=6945 RepID=B7PTT8_IXOSC|nr:hypothetical protein IscW_ISCW019357 [Ixodes scapularis]|eukprot:XP_002404895.1 hypothetical protein IscW_ISCW019357 [Ixodes scapularis]
MRQNLGHVRVLLWRTLWVQALRRHYFYTGAELLLVVLCFRVFAMGPSMPDPADTRVRLPEQDSAAEALSDFAKAVPEAVLYAPHNAYTDTLVRDAYPVTVINGRSRPQYLLLETGDRVAKACVSSFGAVCVRFEGNSTGMQPDLNYTLIAFRSDGFDRDLRRVGFHPPAELGLNFKALLSKSSECLALVCGF